MATQSGLLSPATSQLRDGRSPLEHALGDGEDFELVLAVSAEDGRRLLAAQPVEGITLYRIGECVQEGLWLEEQGVRRALPLKGYVHELR